MNKFKNSVILLFVILAAVYILNITVMYVFFDINILNPRVLFQNERETPLESKNTPLVSDPINRSETNTKLKSDVSVATRYYMTADEVAFLSQLSLEDKLSAMAILTKLEVEDRNRILEMSLDGVTIAEYDELNASVESKLEETDVEALKEILYRSKMLYAENSR